MLNKERKLNMGNKIAEWLSALTTTSQEVTADILVLQFTIVNAFIVGCSDANKNEWVLVDTGLENSADFILASAQKRFGKDSRPECLWQNENVALWK